MYKNLLIIFFIIINFTSLKAEEKITFLNIDSLIQNSNFGKSTLKEIEDLNKKNLLELKKREQDIRKKEQDLINKKNIISEEEFKKNALVVKKEINEFNLYKKQISVEFENKKKDILNKFFERIRPIIEIYINEKKISAVLNKKNIFIANKKYDITNDLIEVINEKIK
tara:strand:+ start:532 stop:1035 length:504 start_codon:yes stop_codon:yes gene_type:complete